MKKLAFLNCLILLFSCGNNRIKKEIVTPENNNLIQLTEAQMKLSNIKLGMLTTRNISTTIRVNGKIDVPPQNLISVSVPLGGYLKSSHLLPGMHISKGEVIAVMEDQQYIQLQQDYLISRIKLQTIENEYQRQKELNESKASSDKVFQNAKADYQTMKINTYALSEKLKLININPATLNEESLSKNINIYAPFDGFVSKVNANIGKYITPSDVIFELVNPNDIHLNLKVFERDLVQLSIGQKLLAYTNNHPGKKYKCEILEISKDITNDRTAEVHSHFENYDKALLPGMYMNAEIEINSKQVTCIDERAVVAYGSSSYVFVKLDEKIFEMQKVETGVAENGFVEVINAANFKNKELVTQGAYTLLMALKAKGEE